MPLRIRATSPVYCGRCGKRRGLLHTCIVRKPDASTRLKAPKVMLASCPSCGKPYANPLTHVCQSKRGDFGRRKAAYQKAQKAAVPKPQRPAHDYKTCDDEDCRRYGCRVYREGYGDGNGAGYAAGQAAGYVDGFEAGQSAKEGSQ